MKDLTNDRQIRTSGGVLYHERNLEMNKYKVRLCSPWYRNEDEWEVIEFTYNELEDEERHDVQHYRGSLADCEAWIRLKEDGYLD